MRVRTKRNSEARLARLQAEEGGETGPESSIEGQEPTGRHAILPYCHIYWKATADEHAVKFIKVETYNR